MITIRLSKYGKKNDHFFRIVATDSKVKNNGEPLKVLGHWHPRTSLVKIDKTLLDSFVAKGAQVSEAVKKLLDHKTK